MISCLLRLMGFIFCVYGWEITWIFVAEKIEGNGGFSGKSCLMTKRYTWLILANLKKSTFWGTKKVSSGNLSQFAIEHGPVENSWIYYPFFTWWIFPVRYVSHYQRVTMENHHFSWPFSIATLNYQRVRDQKNQPRDVVWWPSRNGSGMFSLCPMQHGHKHGMAGSKPIQISRNVLHCVPQVIRWFLNPIEYNYRDHKHY